MSDKLFLFLFFFVSLLLGIYYTYIDPVYIVDLKGFLIKTPVYFIPTLLISILALYVTSRNYLRKSGYDISALYRLEKNFTSTEYYMSKITLANKKDKPVIINKIYLRLGHNIYIDLTPNEDPFILKPFESITNQLEPHLAYMDGFHILDNLYEKIMDEKIKHKIILETNEGLIKCKDLTYKNVMHKIFQNHLTFLILRHKGKFINGTPIGNNILYFIEIYKANEENSFLAISINPEKTLLDGKLIFDTSILITKQGIKHIEDVINEAIKNKIVNWESFKVYSQLEEFYTLKDFNNNEKIDLTNKEYFPNFLEYHILGPIFTYFEDRKEKIKNRKKKVKHNNNPR